jgi:hypothetical protein
VVHDDVRGGHDAILPLMGMPGAKQDDEVIGLDTHIIMIPSPAGPVATPMPMPFIGKLSGALSTSVKIDGKAATAASGS